jgi:1,2-diacylglycerol 3-beta-galactosyltransferase
LRTFKNRKYPFITVVTDMVSTHAAWFDNRADLIIVPTESARQNGISFGISQEKLKVIGLPVADRFRQKNEEPMEIRKRLGWPLDLPVILLVGGGEGMGPLEKTAHAINEAGLEAALVVITGRNRELKTRLENYDWKIPASIYGFVRTMPDFMQAANVLVTKAGPGTISEACISGLPIILYSKMPGQEDGNVDYVVSEGAGVWAPEPSQVVATLQSWIEAPELRWNAAAACRRIARRMLRAKSPVFLPHTSALPNRNRTASMPIMDTHNFEFFSRSPEQTRVWAPASAHCSPRAI